MDGSQGLAGWGAALLSLTYEPDPTPSILAFPMRTSRLPPRTEAPSRQSRRGHGRVTLRDVAQEAGVTSITVSRYLREPSIVAAETAERIRQALAATGYVPNKQAGLLASGVSNIVAALLPNLANSIFAETAQGLSAGLQAAGYELLIASTGYSLEREEHQLRALLGWHPAAVVVTGRRHAAGAVALLEAARAAGTPVVEIWDHRRPEPGARRTPGFTQVGFDHAQVGRAMAQHLLDAGHRDVAYVDSGVVEDYRAHERGQAFIEHARAAGARARLLVAPEGDAFDGGRHCLDRLLDLRSGRVTAAAFANDNLACGALLEANRRQVAIPGRLALLGFGDFAISRQLTPSLSSVQLPRHDIGAETARALIEALRQGRPAQSAALTWTVVGRGSTGS